MRFTGFIRHHFWAVILVLLVPSAYLQACGISALAASSIAAEQPLPPYVVGTPEGAVANPPQPSAGASRSAQPILDRNVFDSTRVPLRDHDTQPAVAEPPAPTNPLEAPECEGVWVTSTMVERNPLRSTAVLRAADERQGSICRVGDYIGTREVAYIGFNPLERSPAVWLDGAEGLCQSVLFADGPPKARKKTPKRKTASQLRAERRKRRNQRRRPPPVPKAIAQKIERLSPTEFLVDRGAVDAIMDQHAKLMRSVRVRPNQKGGRTTSLTLSRVTESSLLGTLGLRNGDRLISINGFELTSPERALEAYAGLRAADEISLRLMRGSKPMIIDYRIQ
jgi:general secretion pathway protein C